MFVVIVGGGRVGTYLARGLLKQEHEVVVIEKDARKAQMMTNLLEPPAKVGHSDLELVQLRIADDSPSKGRRIADIQLPRGSVIVAVDRGGGDVVVPNGDTLLQRGDDVIAMIKRETRADVCTPILVREASHVVFQHLSFHR